jgi:hypothetical protein
MSKAAVVAPAGTAIVDGTVAAALSADIVNAKPLAGAAPLSVTVPCAARPPTTDESTSIFNSDTSDPDDGPVVEDGPPHDVKAVSMRGIEIVRRQRDRAMNDRTT